jgi:ribulose-phosphate 3-epimerase
MKTPIQIFPSLMAADQTQLLQEVQALEAHCAGFHLDVMDDHFVFNLALSYDVINQLAEATKAPLFVHLMVEHVPEALERLKLPAGTIVSFHLSATKDPQALAQTITQKGWVASVAYASGDSTAELYAALDWVNHILLMSVIPGFSGQDFEPEVLTTLDELYGYKKTKNLNFTIAMDGAITEENIYGLALRGVQQFCIGSAIFDEADRQLAVEKLYAAGNQS